MQLRISYTAWCWLCAFKERRLTVLHNVHRCSPAFGPVQQHPMQGRRQEDSTTILKQQTIAKESVRIFLRDR